MSINRSKLCDIVHEMIGRVQLPEHVKDIVCYLTDIITTKDPVFGVKLRGNLQDWRDLPPSKCLRCSPQGVGMPIGDLTSQLFSNVFLNKMDWYITKALGFKHYGRYVDDFYIVDLDKQRLKEAKEKIKDLLFTIGLVLHPQKVKIQSVFQPIAYLGAIVRPYYKHCSSKTFRKFLKYKRCYIYLCKHNNVNIQLDNHRCLSSMNSYIGYLRHFKAYRQLMGLLEN